MNITLLPDMEEKRKKRQIRKQKRQARINEKNFERRRKCFAKKPGFLSVYMKCFAVILIIGIVITAVVTILVEQRECNKVKTQYSLWQSGVYNAVDTARIKILEGNYTEVEAMDLLRRELKLAMIENNYSNWCDFAAIAYSIDLVDETNPENIAYGSEESEEHMINDRVKLLCDSGEAVLFVNYENGNIKNIYECPKEIYGQLYDEIIKIYSGAYTGHSENKTFAIEEYYVKGNTIIPGKVWFADNNESGYVISSTMKEYDLTPGDTSGYTYINRREEDDKVFNGKPAFTLGSVYGGTKEGSAAYRDVCEKTGVTYYDTGAVAAGGDYDTGKYNIKRFNLDDDDGSNVKFLNYEFLGKKIVLITRGYFFFYKIYFKTLVKVYIAVLVGIVLVSLFIARMRWIKIKTQYEMVEYRRTITDSMAHDLKSPLMAVLAMAENLKENVHTEKRNYYADAIVENVSYMNELIEHILDLSKVEGSCFRLEKSSINLEQLVDSVVEKYSILIDEKNISIDSDADLTIEGDEQLMKQAIDNLINNAIKYTKEGKYVTIKTEGRVLTICNYYENADKLDVNELVMPFTKADKSRSNKSGSGIGLAIVKNILAEHGYKLVIKGDGDEFKVQITF